MITTPMKPAAGTEAVQTCAGRLSRRGAVRRRLLEIWPQSDDSRQLETLIADVRSSFGILAEGLPFREFADGTIEAWCDAIEANIDDPPIVARLQPRGAGCPLFLIHAGGGYVFFYRALASHLAPDYPVYGIRAETDADGHGRPLHGYPSLEELAARYVVEMRTIQPSGPYAIGGGSFGAVVAFEMARQLRACGVQVRVVLMFSPVLVGETPAVAADRQTRLRRRIAYHWTRASQLETAEAVHYVSRRILDNAGSQALAVLRRIRRAKQSDDRGGPSSPAVKRQTIAPELTYRCTLNMRAATRLLASYVPKTYNGRVMLFRASADVDPVPFWIDCARGGLDVHDSVGGHLDMLEEPAAGHVAQIVRAHLCGGAANL